LTNFKQLWATSLLFRRIVCGSLFLLATLLVYLGSHIPRSVSLPADDLNAKITARLGDEQIIVQKPAIEEGGIALSYVGNKNEIADLWLDNAILDDGSQHLLLPGSNHPNPTSISYTTSAKLAHSTADDTCHTTIEVRRAKGSNPIEKLKLFQTDGTAGAQRFRQVVLDAGSTMMEIEVHTDSPTPGKSDLPGCHKLLTVGGEKPIDLPPLPVRILVPGGKIDLHFNPANPVLPIFTGPNQTFEAVSLGEDVLRANSLQIIPNTKLKAPAKLDIQGHPAGSSLSFGRLRIGADSLRLEAGNDLEKAMAYSEGSSIYNYDLVDAVQKNPLLSAAIAAVLAPGLWKWTKKNCFPNMSD
jgi:hypothetical protein